MTTGEGEGEDKAEGKSGLAVAYFYAVGNVTLDVVAATITVAEHGAYDCRREPLALRLRGRGAHRRRGRGTLLRFCAAGEATVGKQRRPCPAPPPPAPLLAASSAGGTRGVCRGRTVPPSPLASSS